MALTRPRLGQLTTTVSSLSDALTVLHAGATAPNVDVGFLMNRANGLVSNVALYWNEAGNTFVTAFTSNSGATDTNVSVTSYANVTTGAQIITPGTTLNSTSTSTGALVVTGGVGISGNLYVGGNISAANFLGNVFFGPTPTTTYYTQAPLNLTNSLAGGIKTQLNLINTGGGAGAGAGIDFYTYTSVSGSNYPEARIAAVDDGNYSSYITFQTKIPGNTGANALAERIKIDSAGNIVIPTTTVSTSTTTGALVVAGGSGIAGNVNVGGNITQAGYHVINSNINLPALQITGAAIKGGAGYHDFLSVTNLGSGVTNPNKYFRMNSTGNFEIINSAYTSNLFTLTDDGNITIPGKITVNALYTTTGLFWSGNNNVISSGGGGSAPAGSTGQVQYNNGGTLGASTLYYWSGNNVITTTSAVTAGSIQGTPIGSTTTSSGAFTSLSATSFKTTQNTVTIGTSAGLSSQGTAAVAVGLYAGYNTQGAYSVAIGNQAGQNTVGQYSVLAGYNAGFNSTSANVVSIGPYAGYQSAATNSVAIGNQAGYYQTASGIVINATGNQLNGNVAGFVVAPVRNDTGNISLQVAYNTTTNEFTYSNTISVASAIVGGTLTVSGNTSVTSTFYAQGIYDTGNRVLSSVTVTAGTGMSGGGTISGPSGTVTLTNAGVTGLSSSGAGNLTVSASTGAITVALPTSGPGAATVGSSTAIPVITTDAYGRISSTSTAAVVAPAGTLSGATLASGVTASSLTSVGTLTGLTVSGAILASTANTINIGSTTNWFNNIYGTAIHALYADLAENYTADAEYNPGTVVVFGGNKEITVTTQSHDPRVAGVISTNPAYLMNGANPGLPVAFTGRVPCQVQGPVTKGQVLVTSTTAGVAEAIDNSKFLPGCVVGKALEAINTNTIETIEVVVGRF